MIQNVGEDALEFQIDTLGNPNALLDAEVHIPVSEPAEDSRASIPCIDSENWVAPVRGLEHSVREIVHREPIGLSRAVARIVIARTVVGMTVGNGADGDGVFHVIVTAADAVA